MRAPSGRAVANPGSAANAARSAAGDALGVPLPNDPQAGQREQVVGDVDRRAVRDDRAGQAARGEGLELAELLRAGGR